MKKILNLMLAVCLMTACSPDKKSVSLGSLPDASFTVSPLTGAVNTYVLTSTSTGVFSWSWDPGDGTGSKPGGQTDTVYYAKKGSYKAILLVLNKAGYDTISQVVTVPNDDPGINILQGSAMDAASQQYWTVLNTGGPQTSFTFGAQGVNLSNTGNTNGAIYQAVQVKAGVQYTFSANMQGAGATNSWIEVYLGTSAPVQGNDYSDNKINSLNTWSGCGGSAFNGNVSDIGCSGTLVGAGGKIKFAANGTVYVLLKAGSSGGTLGTGGITVSNIMLTEPSH
ncbi:MAG TPA: PKD domain-containing protein [Puia sp.]|nr:PKD domain-containing protein [Puia sp.]